MNTFPFGASYYPIFQEDYKKGLSLLKKNNINFIRTAEIFNSWDTIEKSPKNYDIDFLDRLFQECANQEIQILLGTGTSCPPYWLAKDYQVHIIDQLGRPFPNNATYSWACMNNPHFLEAAERYIRFLVERYKDHTALFAYQLHNEIGYPFMPNSSGELGVYCYCESCTKKFQGWLKNKYQSLEKLQHAYRWSTTNSQYSDWSEITPPQVMPAGWSSVTRWLDFRLFSMEVIVDFLKWQKDLIKSMDTEHPCTTNIFFQKGEDPLGVLLAIDQFKIAEVVDIVGYDLYPGSSNKQDNKPYYCSMFLDHARSISQPLNKPFWLLETEGGPIKGWMAGPERNTSPADLERYLLEAIGHGAKLSLYQLFTEPPYQPLHWGGVVSLDGQETVRTPMVRKLGDFVSQHSSFILNSSSPKGEVAILLDKENMITLFGVKNDFLYIDCLNGIYTLLWEKGIQVDFITTENLSATSDYHTIFTPFLALVNKNTAQALADYVQKGGILIGTPRMGVVGENGWSNISYPAFALEQVFGVRSVSVVSAVSPNIGWQGKNYKGYWHQESLQCTSETQIEAWFGSDEPAIVTHKYGKGLGVFFATHSDAAYLKEGSYLMWDYLDHIWKERGITQRIRCLYSNRKNREIDPHLLISDDQKTAWIVMTNYTKDKEFYQANQKKIRLELKNFIKTLRSVSEIYDTDASDITINQCENDYTLELSIRKDSVRILKLEGEFVL